MRAESVTAEQAGGNNVVKSADRALVILELLSRGRHRLSDIAETLHLPLSSVHGLLGTLVHRGFVEFDPTTRTYGLGLKAWTVGQGYTGHRDIVGLALPLMEDLAQLTGETVQLSRLDGTENVYIAIAESPQPMKLVTAVGMRLPAHSVGLGKALLTGLDDAELQRRYPGGSLERFTANTVTDPDALLAEVRGAREAGYAADDEEYIIGCRCLAMPIHDHSGEVIAALSVAAPTPRCGPTWTEETRIALSKVTTQIESHLRRGPPPISREIDRGWGLTAGARADRFSCG